MQRCYIIGASPEKESVPDKKDGLVIAADGGVDKTKNYDIAIGDFDSLGRIPHGENTIVLPTRKDDTDMMLAVKEGLKRNCDRFVISCALGGLLDHTIANIQVLAYLDEHGAKGCLAGTQENVILLHNGTVHFRPQPEGRISIFAYADPAVGVTIEGLSYETDNVTLTPSLPLGVSNEFIGREATITVKEGFLLIIYQGPWDLSDHLA